MTTTTLVSLCFLSLSSLATSKCRKFCPIFLLRVYVGQIEVILSADSNSTEAGYSFVFNCSANSTGLTLYIDDATDSPKAGRVNTTDLGDNVTQYTFFDTVPKDNGTVFQCFVENFGSNQQTLIVYCKLLTCCGWHCYRLDNNRSSNICSW